MYLLAHAARLCPPYVTFREFVYETNFPLEPSTKTSELSKQNGQYNLLL